MGVIYCITNLINNKQYIGQTVRPWQKRWTEHTRAAYNSNDHRPLYKAMRKYGIENFSFTIIETCDDKKLNEREQYWIDKKQTWIAEHPDKGYNVAYGGGSSTKYSYDYIRSLYKDGMTQPEIKEALQCDPWVIRQAIMTDKTITDIDRQEHRHTAAIKGQARLMKKVQAIDPLTNEIYKTFNSISEASQFFSIDHACISTAIRKGRPHKCRNYYWEYCNQDEIPRKAASIVRIDLNNNQEVVYPSVAEAARQCNLNASNIIEAIRKNWRCGQWKWKYNEEPMSE